MIGFFSKHLFLNLAGALQDLLLERQDFWVDYDYNTSKGTKPYKINNPIKKALKGGMGESQRKLIYNCLGWTLKRVRIRK